MQELLLHRFDNPCLRPRLGAMRVEDVQGAEPLCAHDEHARAQRDDAQGQAPGA